MPTIMIGVDHPSSPYPPSRHLMGEGGKKLPGFSLIEMLVVTFLFLITMAILTQSYLTFIRLSHRTANSALVQQDARFVLEYLARNLRSTPIDYPAPPAALDSVTSTLRLMPTGGPAFLVMQTAAGDVRCGDEPTVHCLLVSSDGGINWAPLTSKHVDVETFRVYVRPTITPFVLQGFDYNNDQQPFATIQLKLTYMAPVDKEKVSFEAQTTISSRVYVR